MTCNFSWTPAQQVVVRHTGAAENFKKVNAESKLDMDGYGIINDVKCPRHDMTNTIKKVTNIAVTLLKLRRSPLKCSCSESCRTFTGNLA